MKVLVLLSFSLFTVISSFAQHDPDKLFYFAKAEKYRRMKNVGTALTIGGSVLAIGGIVTLANSTDSNRTTGSTAANVNDVGNVLIGGAVYLMGVGCLGAGIPLWIVGARNERKYDRKLADLSVKFHVDPQRSGLTFIYRF